MKSDLCTRLLSDLEARLSSEGAAKLTETQYEDVRNLREEIRTHCRAGREREARAAFKQALDIIKEGPPSR